VENIDCSVKITFNDYMGYNHLDTEEVTESDTSTDRDTSKPKNFVVDDNTINNLINFASDVISKWVENNTFTTSSDASDESEDDRNYSYNTIKGNFDDADLEVTINIVDEPEIGGRKNRKNKTKRKRNNKQRKSKKHKKQSKRR